MSFGKGAWLAKSIARLEAETLGNLRQIDQGGLIANTRHKTRKPLIYMRKYGERAGIRTLDLLIKSQLLYRLSYALPGGAKRPAEVGGT